VKVLENYLIFGSRDSYNSIRVILLYVTEPIRPKCTEYETGISLFGATQQYNKILTAIVFAEYNALIATTNRT